LRPQDEGGDVSIKSWELQLPPNAFAECLRRMPFSESASQRGGELQHPCLEPIHDVYEMSGLVVAVADADGIAIARPHRKRVDFKL